MMREPAKRGTGSEVHEDGLRRRSAPQPRRGRPRGETRDRILDVALDLFSERGYEQTSLREIAEEMGFTKAAIYYHFDKKDDLLLALHLRMHALGNHALSRLAEVRGGGQGVAASVEVLDEFIAQVLENRKLFLFHARNEQALGQLKHSSPHEADHLDLREQLQRVLSSPDFPLVLRVRMACAIGAIMALLMGATDAFADLPIDELAGLVRDAVHDLMAVEAPARRAGARRPRGGRRH